MKYLYLHRKMPTMAERAKDNFFKKFLAIQEIKKSTNIEEILHKLQKSDNNAMSEFIAQFSKLSILLKMTEGITAPAILKEGDKIIYINNSMLELCKNAYLSTHEIINDERRANLQRTDIDDNYALYCLKEDTFTDALVQCKNRKILNYIKTKIKSCCICFIDIDNLKQINNTFGHHIGDQYIHYFGQIWKQNIRKTDCLIRMDGDEFLLIINNIHSIKQVNMILTRIWKILSDSKKIINMISKISRININSEEKKYIIMQEDFLRSVQNYMFASTIGGVLVQNTSDLQKSIIAANKIMMHAKEKGKNNCSILDENNVINQIYN